MAVTLDVWFSNVQVNIGSGNGSVPSGTEPLSEPMSTNVDQTLTQHMVVPGYNELKDSHHLQ